MRISPRAAVVASVGILSVAVLLHMALAVFPTASGMLGHDYRYFAPYLLAGEQWVRANGWLSPAYFTGAFCGGMPWLANPQSLVWSLPQLLFILQGPTHALLETYLFTAVTGAGATYLVMRRSFGLSTEAALLAGIIFLLNSFLFVRMAVGHLTYHTLFLIPVVALTVMPGEGRVSRLGQVGRIAFAGACFAAMVFGGALNVVVPAALSVAALILIRQTRDGMRWHPWLLLAGSGIWAGGLSAIKLAPAFVLMLQYPRPYLGVGLFLKPASMLRTMAKSLFAPELLKSIESLGRGHLPLGRHELEFGVGIVPLILIVSALILRFPRLKKVSFAAFTLLLLLLALPAALSAGSQDWAVFLSHVPIINNNTIMIRWWMIYLVPLAAGAALAFDSFDLGLRRRPWALAGASLLVMGQSWHRDLGDYTGAGALGFFDPAAIIAEHRVLAQGGALPPIQAMGQPDVPESADMRANEALLAGASSLPCYEPVFGYSLEKFPALSLAVGPVAPREDGTVNMADPRCYLSGDGCVPGAPMAASKAEDLEALESYRPLPWVKPAWQRFATMLSAVMAVASLLALAAGLIGNLRKPAR